MLQLTLFLLISLNAIHGNPAIDNDMLINAYKDYQTTILNVNVPIEINNTWYFLPEMNPIPRAYFEAVDYNPTKLDIAGAGYLLLIYQIQRLSSPYRQILTISAALAHMHGVYTWYRHPLNYTVLPDTTRITLISKTF